MNMPTDRGGGEGERERVGGREREREREINDTIVMKRIIKIFLSLPSATTSINTFFDRTKGKERRCGMVCIKFDIQFSGTC